MDFTAILAISFVVSMPFIGAWMDRVQDKVHHRENDDKFHKYLIGGIWKI